MFKKVKGIGLILASRSLTKDYNLAEKGESGLVRDRTRRWHRPLQKEILERSWQGAVLFPKNSGKHWCVLSGGRDWDGERDDWTHILMGYSGCRVDLNGCSKNAWGS